MFKMVTYVCLSVLTVSSCAAPEATSVTEVSRSASDTQLRDPAAFASISNSTARSEAIFLEAAKVISSPRCMNCHPADRKPTQGDDFHPHVPFMLAGAANHGPAGLDCKSCHQSKNVATYGFPIATIPGDAHWALAPSSMAWQGKSVAQICAQLKDPARNGGRSLKAIHEHVTRDTLVGWAWQPGEGRTSAPGTQKQFGALILAWIESGAVCPSDKTEG